MWWWIFHNATISVVCSSCLMGPRATFHVSAPLTGSSRCCIGVRGPMSSEGTHTSRVWVCRKSFEPSGIVVIDFIQTSTGIIFLLFWSIALTVKLLSCNGPTVQMANLQLCYIFLWHLHKTVLIKQTCLSGILTSDVCIYQSLIPLLETGNYPAIILFLHISLIVRIQD